MITVGHPMTITPPWTVMSPCRAAGRPPIITVAEPMAMASGGPTHKHMSPTTAAGRNPIMTVGTHGPLIGPPTCGIGGSPGVTIGQVCISESRAASGIDRTFAAFLAAGTAAARPIPEPGSLLAGDAPRWPGAGNGFQTGFRTSRLSPIGETEIFPGRATVALPRGASARTAAAQRHRAAPWHTSWNQKYLSGVGILDRRAGRESP